MRRRGTPRPSIGDFGLIGDRRSAAVVARDGTIAWYCPRRFDHASLFAALLDPEAGAWTAEAPGTRPAGRAYLEQSGVLRTRFANDSAQEWTLMDWMTAGDDAPAGVLCRQFSPSSTGVRCRIAPRPDYARAPVHLQEIEDAIHIGSDFVLHASHRLCIVGEDVVLEIPANEPGWAVLGNVGLRAPSAADLDRWLEATLAHWAEIARDDAFEGPYAPAVAASLRAIRLLCHEASGGIIAAATTSLPEIPGGARNYDYRYVWLRDAGMIASALTRLGGSLHEGREYLKFICASRGSSQRYPLAILTTLDGKAAPGEQELDLRGYDESRPVRIGNGARDQFQLDAFANVLLAAKFVYARSSDRPHWDAVQSIADFIATHWREPDHGIWEESPRHQYTSSKVVAACGLESVAGYCEDARQAACWRGAAHEIRAYVASHCLTSRGAYAAYAGSDAVDVSAALFPVWAYTEADAPEMLATIAALEQDSRAEGGMLYRRHLVCADAAQEGAFLAGTLWVAQYWVMRGDVARARSILDAVLACANDLGILPEEADPRDSRPLGNFPQAFVHAALIGVAIDLRGAKS